MKAVSHPGKIPAFVRVLVVTWLLATSSVFAWMAHRSGVPGDPGLPPQLWPSQSALATAADESTILVFVHPRCPCSRATLSELDVLLAQCNGFLRATVVFIVPEGVSENWAATGLWQTASQMKGVTTVLDHGGVEARRFHAETSGSTRLYGKDGRLMFSGGLTLARGHAGDNPGHDAVVAMIRGKTETLTSTPVFGCPIFNKCATNLKEAAGE